VHRKSLAIPAVAFLILSGGGGIGRLGTTSVHAADTYSGTISVTDYQAPNALGGGGGSNAEANQELMSAMYDSALGLDYKGHFYADLATEIPSTANGGLKVTNGDETITYHLKPNQKWSDGSPITTADWIAQWAFLNYSPDIAEGPGTPADQLLTATM